MQAIFLLGLLETCDEELDRSDRQDLIYPPIAASFIFPTQHLSALSGTKVWIKRSPKNSFSLRTNPLTQIRV